MDNTSGVGRRYFSLATSGFHPVDPDAVLIGRAVDWPVTQRNRDGTWGGEDALDLLVCTNHAVMTPLCIGCPPESSMVRPAIEFLATLDVDRYTTFFWRAGTLLNLPEYRELVENDVQYVWSYRKRIGGHRDYPIPFFLLKLIRFADPPLQTNVDESAVLEWVLPEWDEESCWYSRTSITSMATALLYDIEFPQKERVLSRSIEFLCSRFKDEGEHVRTW